MSTLVRANNSRDRGSAVLYVKGASEVLLEECESEFDANGEVGNNLNELQKLRIWRGLDSSRF